jgi:hypothetical protein
LSKTVQRTTFSLWSESATLPFVRSIVQQKSASDIIKIAVTAGVEQEFMPRKLQGSCFLAPQASAQRSGSALRISAVFTATNTKIQGLFWAA